MTRSGDPIGWHPVDGPPECLSVALLPLSADDGRVRPVMLLVWRLDEYGGALVQPVLRGQDDPLPWGLRTNVRETTGGLSPVAGIGGYDDSVMPMVFAIEGMRDRGMDAAAIAVSWEEAVHLARLARDAIRTIRDLPG